MRTGGINTFIRLIRLVPLVALLVSCGQSSFDGSNIDVDRLCSLSKISFEQHDFSGLLSDVERQLGVKKEKVRIAREGVYIPMHERFVNEEGIFLAKPGVRIDAEGTDPSFYLIGDCVYRYEIKG
jgi:hypothetical protein